eukprot:CAMPEP_0170498022 /NCGR_PEP_ID=MMETSP0208-20121228/26555_1 /TAXON_ID=197538 /ORGANISM="Strombidium inclinatum, Strain S3" /LENGTH=62 /DNA_ID=CAMNT_0010775053 /DNA_START=86 /DNA_END=271 /DNA_ORIENTATION=-
MREKNVSFFQIKNRLFLSAAVRVPNRENSFALNTSLEVVFCLQEKNKVETLGTEPDQPPERL